MSEPVLDSDNGIIAVALKMYANFVEEMEGPEELYERALALSYQFRDADDE